MLYFNGLFVVRPGGAWAFARWGLPALAVVLTAVLPVPAPAAQDKAWAAANEAVREAGGWKQYLRESAQARQVWEAERKARDERLASWDFDQLTRLALARQPGLSSPVERLRAARRADQEPALYARATSLSVEAHTLAIHWAHAREAHQVWLDREDLAEVQLELGRRMQAVGNLPQRKLLALELAHLHTRANRLAAQSRARSAEAAFERFWLQYAPEQPRLGEYRLSLVLPAERLAPQEVAWGGVCPGLAWNDPDRARRMFERARAADGGGPLALAVAYSRLLEAEALWRDAREQAVLLQQEVWPRQQALFDEQLLQYNGMLIGAPKLLEERQHVLGTSLRVLDAQRDFWLAQTRLCHQQALVLLEEIPFQSGGLR